VTSTTHKEAGLDWLRSVCVEQPTAAVLPDTSPMDIADPRRIAAVIVGGQYLSRTDLDERMRRLLKRHG